MIESNFLTPSGIYPVTVKTNIGKKENKKTTFYISATLRSIVGTVLWWAEFCSLTNGCDRRVRVAGRS